MWLVPVLISLAKVLMLKVSATSSVMFALENVVPKLDSWQQGISACMGLEPVRLEAFSVAACSRLRLFWTNIDCGPLPTPDLDPASALEAPWRPLWDLFPDKVDSEKKRFGTFLRSFGPGAPREFPRPYPRLPLSSYSTTGLVYNSECSAEERSLIIDGCKKGVFVSVKDLRTVGASCIKVRGALVDRIHFSGHHLLRPLHHGERELAMGFPKGASLIKGDIAGSDGFIWGGIDLTGNSFVVPVISHLLKPWADHLTQGAPLRLLPGSPDVHSEKEAMALLVGTPSKEGNSTR